MNKKEQANVWLAFATAAVAGRSRPAFDSKGEAIVMDPEDIEEDAIEIADRMTRAYAERSTRSLEEEEEENEDEDEDDEGADVEVVRRGGRRR
jgi:hypothetical protein